MNDKPKDLYSVVWERGGVRYYFNRFNEKGESFWYHGISADCTKPRPKDEAKEILAKLEAKNPNSLYMLVKEVF